MRKIVTVVGIGKRRAGVSKSGNAYDFTPLSVSFEEKGYEGLRVAELNASTDELNVSFPSGVIPGDPVEVFMHEDFRRGGWVLDGIV